MNSRVMSKRFFVMEPNTLCGVRELDVCREGLGNWLCAGKG